MRLRQAFQQRYFSQVTSFAALSSSTYACRRESFLEMSSLSTMKNTRVQFSIQKSAVQISPSRTDLLANTFRWVSFIDQPAVLENLMLQERGNLSEYDQVYIPAKKIGQGGLHFDALHWGHRVPDQEGKVDVALLSILAGGPGSKQVGGCDARVVIAKIANRDVADFIKT